MECAGTFHSNRALRARARHRRDRPRQELGELLDDAHGARPGPPAAVRRGERLVQVEVHDVDAHLARLGHPEDGVEVRAVAVDQPARLVHQPRDLQEVLLEQPERVGVGEHEPGNPVVQVRPQTR